ncbi:MAG: TlpA family protein disulfide reductase [Anaerolineae bacterium]|nr:TlpA family protein disulfide reductase [Anaerolineae bacterium]
MNEPSNTPAPDLFANPNVQPKPRNTAAILTAGGLGLLACCLVGLLVSAVVLQQRNRAANQPPIAAPATLPPGITATLPAFATPTAPPPPELRQMRPEPGYTPPDFTLASVGGYTHTLSEHFGKPILINFFTSWCGPCREEMPAIQSLFEQHQPDGLVVLAVNVTRDDYRSDVIDFAQDLGLTFPVLLDESGDAARAYHINSYPTSYFVGTDAVINEVVYGSMDAGTLQSHLDGILP